MQLSFKDQDYRIVRKKKVVKEITQETQVEVELDQVFSKRQENEWITKNIREMPGYTREHLATVRNLNKQMVSAKLQQVEQTRQVWEQARSKFK